MPPVARARPGEVLRVRGRELPFSYFPVGRGGGRKEVYDSLFATSPWAVMSGRITDRLQGTGSEAEALAFLDQARQFYATAGSYASANPLLYYYAFLNIAKPLIRVRGFEDGLGQAIHGLRARKDAGEDGSARFLVKVDEPPRKKDGEGEREETVSVFAELSRALNFDVPAPGRYDVEDLMSQVVIGHRLWRQGSGSRELFLGLERVEMRRNASDMWLRLLVREEDLKRFELSHREVLDDGRLREKFEEVAGEDVPAGCVAFQQRATVACGQQATDRLDGLVDGVRDLLWRIVSADAEQGYRKYYLHLSPPTAPRLPQLLSMWMLLFHFGSMVRYQPHVYAEMTRGRYGAFIQEFVAAQPEQMIYLLASELCQREVAKPAIA